MKTLIVEDDFTSRLLLQKILTPYGECHIAVNGKEAIDAFILACNEEKPYDLICLDIMMPEMDGKETLERIRKLERDSGIRGSVEVKVIMTTALGDPHTVVETFYKGGATAYMKKPIYKAKLLRIIKELGLI